MATRSSAAVEETSQGGQQRPRVDLEADFESRSLAARAISIMLTRYRMLPKRLWDLCRELSDPKEQRGLELYRGVPDHIRRLFSNARFDVVGVEIHDNFNRQILPLPPNVKEVKVDYAFNQPLVLAPQVESVELWESFNRPIYLPPSVRLFMKYGPYNHPIHLPEGVIEAKLSLYGSYHHPISLPITLKKLEVRFVAEPMVLPPYLETLKWENEIATGPLPSTLEELVVCDPYRRFDHPLQLPLSLRVLDLVFSSFDYPLALPAGLQELKLPKTFTHPLELPPSLEIARLYMEEDYAHPIDLPYGLKELCLAANVPLELPSTLVDAHFMRGYDQPLALPYGLQRLNIEENIHIDLPPTLVDATFGYYFELPIVFPPTMKTVWLWNDEYRHDIVLPPGCSLYCGRTVVAGEEPSIARHCWVCKEDGEISFDLFLVPVP